MLGRLKSPFCGSLDLLWSGAEAPARRGGQKSLLRQQDTFEGRASGWAQTGDETNYYAGDQTIRI